MARKFSAAVFILCLCLWGVQKTFAYDARTTHAALTDEIVGFYRALGNAITPEEQGWIVQGAIEEDTTPRWVNHFYDPVHNVSWTGENTGFIPANVVQALLYIGLSPEGKLTAKDWVNNQVMQEQYSRYGGDRTWKRGLRYFADGNKKEAYVTLGHALHLVEDMSVPDHTRNDPHAHEVQYLTGDYGSPYEEYLKKYTPNNIKDLHITESFLKENIAPPGKASIEDYITSLAEYSNKYFFSKDTINDPQYSLPKIMREDGNFGYGTDESGQEFPLVKINYETTSNNEVIKTYFLKNVPEHFLILDAYFSRLSRQAVLNGAGIIALFEKQAKDAVVNKEFPQHLVVVDQNAAKWLTFPEFSFVGEGAKVWDAAKSAYATVAIATQGALASIGNFVSGIFSNSPSSTASTTASTSTALSAGTTPVVIEKISSPQAPVAEVQPPSPPAAPATTTLSRIATSSFPIATTTNSNAVALNASPIIVAAAIANVYTERSRSVPAEPVFSGGGGNGPIPNSSSIPPPSIPPSSPPPTLTIAPVTLPDGTVGVSYSQVLSASGISYVDTFGTATGTFTWGIVTGMLPTGLALNASSTNGETNISGRANATGTYNFTIRVANGPSIAEQEYALTINVPPPLFSQPLEDQSSFGSHYSNNWYQLGSGYSGTLRSLTLRGRVDGTDLAASHISLKEFRDFSYSTLVNNFTISDNAPFTNSGLATTTFDNLSILLKPYFYYRLDTMQDWQNRSVILAGTNTTGTAMFNQFVYGVGRVEYVYTFIPFMLGVGDAATSTLTPPPLTAPGNLTFDFNATNMMVGFSWSSSTDPDWSLNPLHYEIKSSTSTDLSSVGWQSVGTDLGTSFPVVFGESYAVAVRAADNFGNFSASATSTWNFPPGFALLPSQTNHGQLLRTPGPQKITLSATTTVSGIALWMSPGGGHFCCAQSFLEVLADNAGASGDLVTSSTPVTILASGGDREATYAFAAPLILSGGTAYWLQLSGGPSPTTNLTNIYGSTVDAYPDGFWFGDPTVDAYFRLLP